MTSKADHIDITTLINMSNLKKRSNTRGGEFKGVCPFCAGTDRFVVWPVENRWSCRQCVSSDLQPQDAIEFVQRRDNVTFKQALDTLGIESTNTGGDSKRNVLTNSKRGYSDLTDYAKEKDIPRTQFKVRGWEDCVYQDRPAIRYPTYAMDNNGKVTVYNRYRFLDGQTPKYKPEQTGTPVVWYGLKRALELHNERNAPLILVNGEASSIVGQHWRLPAFCYTGGEGAAIPTNLIPQLKAGYANGKNIVIAADCDSTGKQFAVKNAPILEQAGYRVTVIDMGLNDGGDFADFCKLYRHDIVSELYNRVPKKKSETVTAHSASKSVLAFAENKAHLKGRPLTFPFSIFHDLGGLCRVMPPGKLMLLFAMSGYGKTAWLETACEYWMKHGYRGIYDGREFKPDEYHFRRVQRWSGQTYTPLEGEPYYLKSATYTDFLLHQMWQQEQRDNTAKFLRQGIQLSDEQVATIKWVDTMVDNWPGSLVYAPRTKEVRFTEDLLLWMKTYIEAERNAKRYVDYVVFDYLHLYHIDSTRTNTSTDNKYMTICSMIKDFCQDNNVFGIVAAQVNKVADKNQRENNRPLAISDARYINDQAFNLTIALNIKHEKQYDTDGKPRLDFNGEAIWDKGKLPDSGNQPGMNSVLKNTMAQTGFRLQQAQLKHYRWLDKVWEHTGSQRIELPF